MKKIFQMALFLAIAGFFGLFIYGKGSETKSELTPIRVAWQVAWVPQGQFVQILKNTDILESNGLSGRFDKFTFGAPMVEAALAGQEDVIFVGSAPALSITSKSSDWKIVSRMEDYRTAIIVPPDSDVRSIADLKHKTVNMPFGSIAYLLGSIEMQKTGFDLKKDVTLQHIDILEQTNIIQKGTSKSWGEAAAFIGWDPTIAQLEEQGKARVLMVLPDTGVVVMSKKFYEAHPEAAKNFLKSLVQAYDFYYKNKQTADDWYLADAGVNFSQRVMEAAGSLERNNNAEGIKNISLLMEDGDIAKMQTEIDQAFSLGIKKKQTSASDINERSFVKDAEKEIDEGNFSKEVRVDLTYDEK